MGIVHSERNSLTTEPITNIVGIAVDHSDADRIVENSFEIDEEVGIDEVTGLLEGIRDVNIGLGIIEVYAEGSLDRGKIKVVHEISGRGGVFVWMADAECLLAQIVSLGGTLVLIDTTIAIRIIRRFDIGPALIRSLETVLLSNVGRPIHLFALGTKVEAAANHVARELHILIDRIVHSFDPVCIVDSKFRIVRSLDALRYDSIDYTQRIEGELGAVSGAIGDQRILIIEVVVEGGTIVATI